MAPLENYPQWPKERQEILDFVTRVRAKLSEDLQDGIASLTERLVFFAKIIHRVTHYDAMADRWNNLAYKERYFYWAEQGKSATQSDQLATAETHDTIYVLAEVRALAEAIKEAKSSIQTVLRTKSDEMRHNDWIEGRG